MVGIQRQQRFSRRVEEGLFTLLVLCTELPHARYYVAWQTHAHNLHDGLEDKQRQVGEIRVGAVLLPKNLHEAVAVAAVVVGVRAHGDEAGRALLQFAQAQCLRTGEEGHDGMPMLCVNAAGAVDEGTLRV
jgi:hypothetical protein